MDRSIVCRAVPSGAEKYSRSPGAGRRQARAPRAADLVRARQEGIPGVAEGDGRRVPRADGPALPDDGDRKSTRLNSSHSQISYAVFCLKKKKEYVKHDPAPIVRR